MPNDLVNRLRTEVNGELGRLDADSRWGLMISEAADRIEELERHIELRDFFLTENDLWEKFAKGTGGKMDDR